MWKILEDTSGTLLTTSVWARNSCLSPHSKQVSSFIAICTQDVFLYLFFMPLCVKFDSSRKIFTSHSLHLSFLSNSLPLSLSLKIAFRYVETYLCYTRSQRTDVIKKMYRYNIEDVLTNVPLRHIMLNRFTFFTRKSSIRFNYYVGSLSLTLFNSDARI